jgi:hypothetical protein
VGTLADLSVDEGALCGEAGSQTFAGSSTGSGCSYEGSLSVDAASAGLSGTLTTTLTCSSGSCTVNFDLVYTKL